MNYLKEYHIKQYINAHDTITLYGASRMAENAKEAMDQISRCFVDIIDLQRQLGSYIAGITHNEAAYIAGSAAGAVQLCAAVSMAEGNEFAYRHLPDTRGLRDEFLVFSCQHNCYDKSIEAAGGRIKCIGDADETLEFELEGSIDEHTAGVFYFPSIKYKRGSLSLEKTVAIAHAKGVPVIVDAAAQLPPVENLWNFTKMGADMVVFSGGKTLCGPQASGLILGRQKFITDCIRFGAPMHGICRSSKVSREGMLGLCVAVDNYMKKDHLKEERLFDSWMEQLQKTMEECGIFCTYMVNSGPVGQTYKRIFGKVSSPYSAAAIGRKMYERQIYIGVEEESNAVYFSPLNLTELECQEIKRCLKEITAEITSEMAGQAKAGTAADAERQ